MDPKYAFQLEAILHDGLLFPREFGQLENQIKTFDMSYGDDVTEAILVELRSRLTIDRFERGRRDVVIAGSALQSEESLPFQLEVMVEVSRHAVVDLRERLNLVVDENHFLCRHVFITPTGRFFEGPFVEQVIHPLGLTLFELEADCVDSQGNSIIRKYPQGVDHFLRVSFVEEDRTQIQVGRWGISKELLWSHVYTPLTELLDLCGRFFEFLAHVPAA